MILVFKMISIPFRVDTEDLAEKFKYLIFLKKTPFFQKIDIWCQKRQWSNFLKKKKVMSSLWTNYAWDSHAKSVLLQFFKAWIFSMV